MPLSHVFCESGRVKNQVVDYLKGLKEEYAKSATFSLNYVISAGFDVGILHSTKMLVKVVFVGLNRVK